MSGAPSQSTSLQQEFNVYILSIQRELVWSEKVALISNAKVEHWGVGMGRWCVCVKGGRGLCGWWGRVGGWWVDKD